MNLVTSSIVSAIILLFIPCLLLQTNSITVVAAFSPSHLLIGSACSTTLAKSLHQREDIRLLSAILQKKKMMMKKKNENGDDDDSSSSTNTDGANVGKRRQNQRRPSSSWDILRFVSQSSKFIRPPSLLLIPQIFIRGGVGVLADKNKRRIGSGEVLWSPASSSSNNFFAFSPLDDVVMGGASYSTMDNISGLWRGVVTDANNGGFAGIRSKPFANGLVLDMSGCKGVILKVRSTKEEEEEGKMIRRGQRYKFVVRDTTDFNGICWTTEFDVLPTTTTTEIRIPFAQQIPTIFAKTIRRQKKFDHTNIVGFQVAYSKFEYDGRLNAKFQLGEFNLQLLELKSF